MNKTPAITLNDQHQKAILQGWATIHTEAEISRAVDVLAPVEREFFLSALDFQREPKALGPKKFDTLIVQLNSLPAKVATPQVSVLGRIKQILGKILGRKGSYEIISQFKKNGEERLGKVIDRAEERMYAASEGKRTVRKVAANLSLNITHKITSVTEELFKAKNPTKAIAEARQHARDTLQQTKDSIETTLKGINDPLTDEDDRELLTATLEALVKTQVAYSLFSRALGN